MCFLSALGLSVSANQSLVKSHTRKTLQASVHLNMIRYLTVDLELRNAFLNFIFSITMILF